MHKQSRVICLLSNHCILFAPDYQTISSISFLWPLQPFINLLVCLGRALLGSPDKSFRPWSDADQRGFPLAGRTLVPRWGICRWSKDMELVKSDSKATNGDNATHLYCEASNSNPG